MKYRMIVKDVVIDQLGEVKQIGFNPGRGEPANMAALACFPEVYGTTGKLIYIPDKPIADENNAGAVLSDMLMDCADLLGATCGKADSRAWSHLMSYAPIPWWVRKVVRWFLKG